MTGEDKLSGILVDWICSNPRCPDPKKGRRKYPIELMKLGKPSPQHCRGWDMLVLGAVGPVYHSSTDGQIKDHDALERALQKLRSDVKAFRRKDEK